MTALLDSLYREVVLDHHRDPRGRHPVRRVDARAHGHNPVCGDDVTLELELDGERVADVSVQSQGCAISVASGSMLAELLVGRTAIQAAALARSLQALLRGESDTVELPPEGAGADTVDIGDLEALVGVRQFPARIKCAALPWLTLLEALATRLEASAMADSTAAVTTEDTSWDGAASVAAAPARPDRERSLS